MVFPRTTRYAAAPLLLLILILGGGVLSGCRQSASATADHTDASLHHFSVRGRVVSTDSTHVTLDHDAIPGFMEAMTMPYRLKDPSVVSELHPGDRIAATILVHQDKDGGFSDAMLDEIVVTAQARPDYKPKVQFHVPEAGDTVPNFALLNQSGKTIHLAQFHGKLLLATFVYTRCTLADFCPRMSRNFAAIDQALAADPKVYAATHLLSISFDPTFDTPQVLRTYGGSYTGRFNQETFAHWDFAAPPVAELPAITQFFGVGVTPGDAKSLTHSLSTVLIGKDGKIIAWYPTNDWEPADLVAKVKQQLAGAA